MLGAFEAMFAARRNILDGNLGTTEGQTKSGRIKPRSIGQPGVQWSTTKHGTFEPMSDHVGTKFEHTVGTCLVLLRCVVFALIKTWEQPGGRGDRGHIQRVHEEGTVSQSVRSIYKL